MENNYANYNKNIYLFSLIVIFLCFLSPARADLASLQQKHQELKDSLLNTAYALPVDIKTSSENESQHGDIYGIIYHPFHIVKSVLTSPASWCDIAPQHLNIKACTHQHQDNHCQLIFYSGRKFYEEPDNTYKLAYNYSTTLQQNNYVQSLLAEKEGYLGSDNLKIIFEATPINGRSTFVHIQYSYKQGFWVRFAMQAYLSTLGKNKVGFTITGTNEEEQPVYVSGVRGVIERNVVRYYFAIKSYLDNMGIAQDKQFMARTNNWFTLTEKYHKQLYEMDRQDYLEYKQAERKNQLELQKEITAKSSGCTNIIYNEINSIEGTTVFE